MSKFSGDKGYHAFRLLQWAFVGTSIIEGLDKFFYVLANWSNYMAPVLLQMVQHYDREMMMVGGAFEIFTGIGLLFKPKVFAYVIALWLLFILLNLLLTGTYLHLALRDMGWLVAALALGNLSQKYATD